MRKHVEESVAPGAAVGVGFRPGASADGAAAAARGGSRVGVRALGITAARASQWRDQFLAAGQAGPRADARDETVGCRPRSASC